MVFARALWEQVFADWTGVEVPGAVEGVEGVDVCRDAAAASRARFSHFRLNALNKLGKWRLCRDSGRQ